MNFGEADHMLNAETFKIRVQNLLKTQIRKRYGLTMLHMIDVFPSFAPNSDGFLSAKSDLTIRSINNTIPAMHSLLEEVGGCTIQEVEIEEFAQNVEERASAAALKKLLDRHGSDKASLHNYHHFYGPALSRISGDTALLEIGLGTSNPAVVSNMGSDGTPGASLRAFRDFMPLAMIYGADIDPGILFQEERIKTYWVDQANPQSFEELGRELPAMLDVIIDDGLHSPDANIRTLTFGLRKVKPGGWVVIEDISLATGVLWKVIASLVSDGFEPFLFRTPGTYVFAVRRKEYESC